MRAEYAPLGQAGKDRQGSAHPRRGAAAGGELRQAAEAAGTAPENANGLQRERRVSMTVSKRFSGLRCQLSRDVLFLLGPNNPEMPD
jgi:hypothetical protein